MTRLIAHMTGCETDARLSRLIQHRMNQWIARLSDALSNSSCDWSVTTFDNYVWIVSGWGSRSPSRWGKFAGLKHSVLHDVIFWGTHVWFWLCLSDILVIFCHHFGKRWFLNRYWYNTYGHTLAILLSTGADLIGWLALVLLVAVLSCANRLSRIVYLRRFSIEHMSGSTCIIVVMMRTVIMSQWLVYLDCWFSGASLLYLGSRFLLTLGRLTSSTFWTISHRAMLGWSIVFLSLILVPSNLMFLWATLLFAALLMRFFRSLDLLTRSRALSSILLLSTFFCQSNIWWQQGIILLLLRHLRLFEGCQDFPFLLS